MPLERPSLQQIIDDTVADVQSRLPGSNPLLRFSLPGVLTKAYAGALHGLYGLLDYYARQCNPATAEKRWLDRWASVWRVTRLDASNASGQIVMTGTPDTAVPLDLQLQSDAGIDYAVSEAATIGANGTATVAVRSLSTGTAANLIAGQPLIVTTPIAGVDSRATVDAGGIAGGAGAEIDDRLRARLIDRISYPPHGGAKFDYERWALEVPAVGQRWVVPLYDGDGTVRVWIGETDYEGANHASAALVDQVQAYIGDDTRKPVTANVTVAAPARVPVDISIELRPNTATVQAAVLAELAQLFERDAVPEGAVYLSRIRESVSIAAGESDNAVTNLSADPQAGTGEILTLGTVTFV